MIVKLLLLFAVCGSDDCIIEGSSGNLQALECMALGASGSITTLLPLSRSQQRQCS